MITRKYATPIDFRRALEVRLKAKWTNNIELMRRRQLLVFDRFLARITATFDQAVTLKGGLALECRVERARTTKDVDLRMSGDPGEALALLREAGRSDHGDFMSFEISPNTAQPTIIDTKYEGYRFTAECALAGKIYGNPFGVDIVYGDPMYGEPDVHTAEDTLDFAGIAPPTLRVYPVETHIAEKLHAYTRTYPDRRNSRVKDLPDLALLATVKTPLHAARLRDALERTFTFRGTHDVPATFPDPPSDWATKYAALARDNQLRWSTLAEVTAAARVFLDPVLAGPLDAVWSPDAWAWSLA